jgi:hypothetical protein
MLPCSVTAVGDCGPLPLGEGGVQEALVKLVTSLTGGELYPFSQGLSLERRCLLNSKLRGGKRWLSKSASQFDKFSFLKAEPVWSTLPSVTLERIAKAERKTLQRLMDFWGAIEDNLLMACPEAFVFKAKDSIVQKIWRWTVSTVLNGGVGYATKLWKNFSRIVKARAIRSKREPAPIRGIPFFNEEGKLAFPDSPVWDWLGVILRQGCDSKSQMTRVLHLVGTRGTPAPTKSEMQEGINEHGSIVTSDPGELSLKPSILRKVALRLGHYAKSRTVGTHSVAHLSLSNSASFDSSRRSGGRASGFATKYAKWANTRSDETLFKTTIFGEPYTLVKGYRVFETMCRVTLPQFSSGSLIKSDNSFDIEVDPMDFKFEDRIFGLDGRTGYQLFQFSIEEGIKRGVLAGDPFYSLDNPLRVVGTPSVRVVPIGEPGFKTRTITVTEDWETEFLSPFGHELTAKLSAIPSASAGLTAAAQAYEWIKRVSLLPTIDEESGLSLLTSDLSQASEYLRHDVTGIILDGFCDGVGITTPYTKLATKLLTQPHFLEDASGPYVYDYMGMCTRRGCLMGNPGTKGALTLTMIVAEELAFLDYQGRQIGLSLEEMLEREEPASNWRCFAAAGDDHLAIGPELYLELIDFYLELLGAKINLEMCYISKIGAYFSEEAILRTSQNCLYSKAMPWDRPYDNHCHVDALKVRLLSPCEKVTLVREEKNVAIGKSKFLLKKLEWLPPGFGPLRGLALARFKQRFAHMIPWDNPMVYMPHSLGGLAFPGGVDLDERIERLSPVLFKAIAIALKERTAENAFLRKALWLMSSNTTFRGITMRTAAEDQLKAIFTLFTGDSILGEEAMRQHLGLTEIVWARTRWRDKISLAKKAGYLSLSEAIQLFERPTYFKEVLSGISSKMKVEPLYLDFIEMQKELDSYCEDFNMVYDDIKSCEGFKEIYKIYEKTRAKWFERQAFIETYAYSLIPLSEECDKKLVLREVDEEDDLSNKSFSTTPINLRVRQIERIIRRYLPTTRIEDSDRAVFNDFVIDYGECPQRYLIPTEVVFIPSARIKDLCTLATPLKAASEWVDAQHRPLTTIKLL